MNPSRKAAVEYCVRRLAPDIPGRDLALVVERGLASPGLGKARPEHVAWLSLVAHVRHAYTDYEAMLEEGYDVDAARYFCLAAMNEVLADWRSPRRIAADADDD